MVLALAAQAAVATVPARAQDSEANVQEIRLRKVEAELRAVQRQVFPGDGAAYQAGAGAPSVSTVATLMTRLDSLEAQNARLTAQVDDLTGRLRLLEGRGPAVAPRPAPEPVALVREPAVASAPIAPTPTASARQAALRSVVRPETGDAGEDEYTYGFKLWQARLYPEAAQQLKSYLDHYPNHARVSYARNLLGRVYMDDGNPREGATWFVKNYQANKRGDRAADSLLYLAEAMVKLKDTNRACIALNQFADDYKVEAAGRLKPRYEDARASVTCN